MDTRGAVDLSLTVSEMALPDAHLLDSADLDRWARDAGFGMPPDVWARVQLTRLAAASVLESRLLHVKTDRLGVFGLVPDPSRVTLQQLAPLHLAHNGTAGQAFEIAVADAVTAGHPEVTGMIRAGLRQLNLSGEGPLSMVVLGVEKVPRNLRDEFWEAVRSQLPEDGRLRTGLRGRPSSVDTIIGYLATSTTKTLQRPRPSEDDYSTVYASTLEYRDSVSQLARADALVACGSDLVGVSLKINRRAMRAETWRHVPLWITVGPKADIEDWSKRYAYAGRTSPRVSVVLPAQGWFGVFRDALDAVDVALNRINRDKPFPMARPYTIDDRATVFRVSEEVGRFLWQMRREPISAVTAELRRAHPGLREASGGFALSPDVVHLTSLDVPELVAGWLNEAEEGRLFSPQHHLFRGLDEQEKKLLVA